MTKFKTSKKAMKDSFNKIISIGYCSLQNLLRYEEAFTYNTRVEGWSCDNYNVEGVLISTGYSPINNKNVNCNYETINRFENLAIEINNSNFTYEEKQKAVKSLLSQFISEVKS